MQITFPDHRPCERCMRTNVALNLCGWCSSAICGECLTAEEVAQDHCGCCDNSPAPTVLQFAMDAAYGN